MKIQLTRLILFAILLSQLVSARPALAGFKPISANVQISDLPTDSLASAEAPALAAHNGVLYAVWKDTRDHIATLGGDPFAIYFAKSTDGGATWSENVRLGDATWDSTAIDTLSIDIGADGTIWVLWHLQRCFTNFDGTLCGGEDRNNDTRLALSNDGGTNWDEVTAFDGDDGFFESDQPALAVDTVNSMGYLLNQQPNGDRYDLLLKFIDGNAATTVTVNNGTARKVENGNGPRRSLMARNGQVCVAWEDSQSSNAIYGTCSNDKGKTFATPTQWTSGNAFAPQLSFAPDGSLHLAYQQLKSIFVRRAATPGGAWSNPQPVALFSEDARIDSLDLAVDSKNMIAVLYPSAGQGITDYDITLATSIDQGANFPQSSLVDPALSKVTARGFVSLATLADAADGSAVAVWQDKRATKSRIWSQRMELDSTPASTPANLQTAAGDTSALISWNAASDKNGVAGYHLFRSASQSGPFVQINPLLIATTSYRDVGLAAGTYFYKVQAVDSTGNRGVQSNPVSAQVSVGTDLSGANGSIVYNVGDSVRLRSLANLGQEQTVATGIFPQFESNGQRVYFKNGTSLLSRKPDGSDEHTLFSDATLSGEPFGIASDGNTFAAAYTKSYFRFGNPVPCTAFEPRIRTADPAADGQVVAGIVGSEIALSPDGRWLAYLYGGLCNSTTVSVLQPPLLCLASVTSDLSRCADFDLRQPDFAPDGNTIAFVADYSGQKEIWKATVNSDGSLSNSVQLTQGGTGQSADKPAWSADGKGLTFQRDTDPGAGENWQLFVVGSDGDRLRSLNVAGVDPDWGGSGTSPTPTPTTTPNPTPVPTPNPTTNQQVYLPVVQR